jgi:pimeloyl-ACP methyl ester carboxylesterase
MIARRPRLLWLLLVCLLCLGAQPADQKPVAKRRVFVLHGGLHTILANPKKNATALRLAECLADRGVPRRDIIVLDNPFPTASWKDLFPREAFTMFFESLSPTSTFSQEAYLRMDRALQEHGVGPTDDVVWIGHSAGGQVGMTTTYLAWNLARYPNLNRKTHPYHIGLVITLGTPIGANLLSDDIQLRNYFSPGDTLIRMIAQHGKWVGYAFGFHDRLLPVVAHLQPNWKARVFFQVEHNEWGWHDRVIERIMAELDGAYQPAWHSALAPRPGLALSQLMCHALDQECNISLEDPPVGSKR